MPQCENINIFGYLLFGGGGGGGSGFNNQTGSILVHLYPLMYINIHVNMEAIHFELKCGPYIKSRGTRASKYQQMQASLQWRDMYIKWTQFKNSCSYIWAKMIFLTIFGYLRGTEGGEWIQWSDWTYLAIQLSFHPYLCTCEKSKQSDKNFLSSNQKYDFFSYLGVLVAKLSGQYDLITEQTYAYRGNK